MKRGRDGPPPSLLLPSLPVTPPPRPHYQAPSAWLSGPLPMPCYREGAWGVGLGRHVNGGCGQLSCSVCPCRLLRGPRRGGMVPLLSEEPTPATAWRGLEKGQEWGGCHPLPGDHTYRAHVHPLLESRQPLPWPGACGRSKGAPACSADNGMGGELGGKSPARHLLQAGFLDILILRRS